MGLVSRETCLTWCFGVPGRQPDADRQSPVRPVSVMGRTPKGHFGSEKSPQADVSPWPVIRRVNTVLRQGYEPDERRYSYSVSRETTRLLSPRCSASSL